jgi:hypothetical protein
MYVGTVSNNIQKIEMYHQYSIALNEYIGLKSSSQKQYMSVFAPYFNATYSWRQKIRVPIYVLYVHDWVHSLCIFTTNFAVHCIES